MMINCLFAEKEEGICGILGQAANETPKGRGREFTVSQMSLLMMRSAHAFGWWLRYRWDSLRRALTGEAEGEVKERFRKSKSL